MTSLQLLSCFHHDNINEFSKIPKDLIDFREPLDVAVDFLDPILKNGASVVAVCVFEGAEQCLSWIFGNVETTNLLDNRQRNLYHFAAASKNQNIYQMIENFVPVDTNFKETDFYGNLPIHYAAYYGNLQILQYLWMNGADLNAKNEDGATPLHFAVKNQQLNIINFLLNNSVPIDTFSNDGVSFL
ncbi:hypothetical protein TRFO_05120 [Tritrichomonas foetus]|uniref:Uncharacterized protein n=1 Tax=Tritrichomonas foetus TaxID=1144522 RepID=A0A1J4KE26_9EUKA|nr:hypothetical protein TRFO_05120 [Tritrichomonas foetus]|eukprot:OHT07972.1 hypothetical protein TRFO_05120 [Tritrichomonas foetus]